MFSSFARTCQYQALLSPFSRAMNHLSSSSLEQTLASYSKLWNVLTRTTVPATLKPFLALSWTCLAIIVIRGFNPTVTWKHTIARRGQTSRATFVESLFIPAVSWRATFVPTMLPMEGSKSQCLEEKDIQENKRVRKMQY